VAAQYRDCIGTDRRLTSGQGQTGHLTRNFILTLTTVSRIGRRSGSRACRRSRSSHVCHLVSLTARAAIYRCALRINLSSPTISSPLFSTGSHTMSTAPSTSTSHSNFASIFDLALKKYNRKTEQDLAKHPLLPRFQSCDSSEAILAILREQSPDFNQSQNTTWVTPTVNVLYSFSATLGGVVGLVSISIFPYDTFQSNIYLSGIPTSKHNLYGDWCSSPGPCLSPLLCTTCFNTLTLRRLKISALAETISSTSFTASKDFSNDLRSTPALHRLRL
jgi:hypothetical protein